MKAACGRSLQLRQALGGARALDVFHRVLAPREALGWHVVLHLDAPDIVPLNEMIRKLPLPS
jgi:hypothetical protein